MSCRFLSCMRLAAVELLGLLVSGSFAASQNEDGDGASSGGILRSPAIIGITVTCIAIFAVGGFLCGCCPKPSRSSSSGATTRRRSVDDQRALLRASEHAGLSSYASVDSIADLHSQQPQSSGSLVPTTEAISGSVLSGFANGLQDVSPIQDRENEGDVGDEQDPDMPNFLPASSGFTSASGQRKGSVKNRSVSPDLSFSDIVRGLLDSEGRPHNGGARTSESSEAEPLSATVSESESEPPSQPVSAPVSQHALHVEMPTMVMIPIEQDAAEEPTSTLQAEPLTLETKAVPATSAAELAPTEESTAVPVSAPVCESQPEAASKPVSASSSQHAVQGELPEMVMAPAKEEPAEKPVSTPRTEPTLTTSAASMPEPEPVKNEAAELGPAVESVTIEPASAISEMVMAPVKEKLAEEPMPTPRTEPTLETEAVPATNVDSTADAGGVTECASADVPVPLPADDLRAASSDEPVPTPRTERMLETEAASAPRAASSDEPVPTPRTERMLETEAASAPTVDSTAEVDGVTECASEDLSVPKPADDLKASSTESTEDKAELKRDKFLGAAVSAPTTDPTSGTNESGVEDVSVSTTNDFRAESTQSLLPEEDKPAPKGIARVLGDAVSVPTPDLTTESGVEDVSAPEEDKPTLKHIGMVQTIEMPDVKPIPPAASTAPAVVSKSVGNEPVGKLSSALLKNMENAGAKPTPATTLSANASIGLPSPKRISLVQNAQMADAKPTPAGTGSADVSTSASPDDKPAPRRIGKLSASLLQNIGMPGAKKSPAEATASSIDDTPRAASPPAPEDDKPAKKRIGKLSNSLRGMAIPMPGMRAPSVKKAAKEDQSSGSDADGSPVKSSGVKDRAKKLVSMPMMGFGMMPPGGLAALKAKKANTSGDDSDGGNTHPKMASSPEVGISSFARNLFGRSKGGDVDSSGKLIHLTRTRSMGAKGRRRPTKDFVRYDGNLLDVKSFDDMLMK